MRHHLFTLPEYDFANGAGTTNVPSGDIPLVDYQLMRLQAGHYGTDQADAKIKLQGSLDQLFWFDIDSVTLAVAVPIAIASFPGGNVIVLSGDKRNKFINGTSTIIAGSTTNDGKKTVEQTNYKGQLDYSNISSGSFTVGRTVTGSVSLATGKIAVDDGTTLTLTDVTGTFDAADVITESVSGKTADVDTVASVTTVLVTETLTVEIAAGDVWPAQTANLVIAPEDTCWLYYRVAFDNGTCTKGVADVTLIGKQYPMYIGNQ